MEDDPVPSYQDAISGRSGRSHTGPARSKSIPIDSNGVSAVPGGGGIPITGMSMGAAVPAIAPISPSSDYFSLRQDHRDPPLDSRNVPSHPPHSRHPGDAGHSVWDNSTPRFAHHPTVNTSRPRPATDSVEDEARWSALAPSPASSPSGLRYAPRSLVGSRSLGLGLGAGAGAGAGMGGDGDRGLWGSPTGDSPRRERNWARRAESATGQGA